MRSVVVAIGLALSTVACDETSKDAEMFSAPPEFARAFAAGCPTPALDTSAWKPVDGRPIRFKLPPDYLPKSGVGLRTDVTHYERGERTVGYCVPCAPFFVGSEPLVRCREEIDGREAYVIAFGPDQTGRFFAGANFVTEKGFLTFGGWSPDLEGQQIVLAAIRTVRFKKDSE